MKRLVRIFLILSFFLIPVEAFAQANLDNHEKRIQELETEVIRLKAQNEHYQYLKAEIKNYREYLTEEEKKFTDFIKYILGAIVLVASGLFAFLSIKSIGDVTKYIKNTAKENMEKLVKTKIAGYTDRLTMLEQLTDIELRLKNFRVLIIRRENSLESMTREIEELSKYVGVVDSMEFNEKDFMKKLEENIDLVVLKYHLNKPSDSDERLARIVAILNEFGQEIPLIIYWKGRVEGADKDTCEEYFWTNYSNSPSTLIGNAYMLTHAIHKKK